MMRSSGKIRNLGDIASFINGFAFKPEDWTDKGLPIIRIQDLTGSSYQANRYSGTYDKRYEVIAGDVLISWSASLGIYVWTGEKAVLNQHIFKVVFDKENVNKSFFIHQVRHILENATEQAHGATMKHLTRPVFNALPFRLPDAEKQKEIADILDTISDLIELRQQQLANLDQLAKSRFVEMFGDSESNTKKFVQKSLGDLFKIGSSKRILQTEQTMQGIPFLRISDLTQKIDGTFESPSLFISEKMFKELQQDGNVPVPGDILITSRGTLGRCYVIQPQDHFYFQDGMISWLSERNGIITNTYLVFLFQQPGFRKQIDKMLAGSTVSYLSITMLKKLQVFLPPLTLQNEFATFIEQLDKSKLVKQEVAA